MPFQPETYRVQADRDDQCQENRPDDVGDCSDPGQHNDDRGAAHQDAGGERPGLREGLAGRGKHAGHLILLSIKMSCFKPRRTQAGNGWKLSRLNPIAEQRVPNHSHRVKFECSLVRRHRQWNAALAIQRRARCRRRSIDAWPTRDRAVLARRCFTCDQVMRKEVQMPCDGVVTNRSEHHEFHRRASRRRWARNRTGGPSRTPHDGGAGRPGEGGASNWSPVGARGMAAVVGPAGPGYASSRSRAQVGCRSWSRSVTAECWCRRSRSTVVPPT